MKKKIIIPLTTDLAGNNIDIQGVVLGSGNPKVCIQSGTHGGELTFWIIKNLFEKLSQIKLVGTVVLIPNVNPLAWNQRIYFSTVGKFSLQTGEDYNRGFPGSQTSLSQRRAQKLYINAQNFDYVVDLHTSRKSIPFSITIKEKTDQKLLKALGLKFNYLLSNQTDDSMMSVLSTTKSTIGFEIECGSHDSLEGENIEMVTQSLMQFLDFIGIIKDKKATPTSNNQYSYTEYIKYFADVTGFMEPIKRPGMEYKKGDELFKIYPSKDYFNPVIIRAEEDGVIIKLIPTYIVWEGDEVLQTVNKQNMQFIT